MAAQRDERLNEWLKRRRERPGIRIVDSDEGTFALMRHLRRGGCMGVIADQDSTRVSGIFVDFFGRPAYTPIGPARLAQSCKVGVLPLSIERDVDDPRVHRLVLGEPILPDAEAGAEAESQRMTQAYTRHLEERIRARPELWVWLHKRWRHRPGEPIRVRRRGGRKSSR
jgi:KDO2-lipid IV(A) lauroyltransferase